MTCPTLSDTAVTVVRQSTIRRDVERAIAFAKHDKHGLWRDAR